MLLIQMYMVLDSMVELMERQVLILVQLDLVQLILVVLLLGLY